MTKQTNQSIQRAVAEHDYKKADDLWEVESDACSDGSSLIIVCSGKTIADCRSANGVESVEKAEANAMLIASAPELMEALQSALEHIEHWENCSRGPEYRKVITKGQCALAKAQGKA